MVPGTENKTSTNQELNILGIIPARAGSKRIPGKNTRILDGKPLISYVLDAATGSTLINQLVVSSDSPEVLEIAGGYPSVKTIKRPVELADDRSPAIDYVKHALDELKPQEFSHIVIIQPSSPLTKTEDIDNTIRLLLNSGADSAVSIMKVDHATHPVKLKILQGDKLGAFWEEENGRMAAHELPELYVRNCAIYSSKISVIEKGMIIGDDCRGYLMPRERSVDINDPVDFEFAGYLLTKSSTERAGQ